MKYLLYMSIIGILSTTANVSAEEKSSPQDTIKTFDIDEIVVTSSSKETNRLSALPGSVSILTPQQINSRQLTSIKDLSSFVPNLYIPDYGAKLTSAIYIRGIGARSSGQSIGLYVDNIPYMDKSSFDFEWMDIQRIEVLRGPQGTLYGRNAMGGIINVHTLSPLDYQGVRASFSYGNYGQLNAKVSGYGRLNENIGISAGVYYDRCDGFFTNASDHKKIDHEDTFGGNLKLFWNISSKWRVSYTASFEHTDQGAFPYGLYNEETGKTAQARFNDESSYKRSLLNNNLSLSFRNDNILLTSVTGYQYLNDDMKMDQDFSDSSVFVLNQLQKQHAFTEEISVKSKNDNRYQWSFGAYGFYDKLNTRGPVEFKKTGIDSVLQPVFDKLSLSLNEIGMPGKLVITDESLPIPGNFETPSYGVAVYHQSTCNRLFAEGLSVTAGIRLDYERQEMTYTAESKMNLAMKMSPMAPPIDISNRYPASVADEKISQDFWQVLPKVSLKYECTPRTFTYLSIAKGYKAGGYNIQMSADIMQSRMRYDVMSAFKDRIPPEVLAGVVPQPIKDVISYKPETSWSYETGVRSELIKNRLHTELTLFYIDVRDLQITKFVDGGSGRVLRNAGKARSLGAELSLRAILSDKFTADLNYGYTNATFRDYNNDKEDFKGNRIPYTPRHTLSAGLHYTTLLPRNNLIHQFFASIQCNGAGKIYWNEANRLSQPFYAVVNAQAGVRKGIVSFSLWARNLTATDYAVFYFESFDKPFMQKGKPFRFGGKVTIAL
ncbi:MAG: TonB-dependent receptor [Tannerella sp.]|jgi:outer membrane receptor protein involved in Fe transport|nr:TonB-dependent receptor [Tannerella sp.]